jgi:hypothetical protein
MVTVLNISRSMARLLSGSDFFIISISGMEANVAEMALRRSVTAMARVAISAAGMTSGGAAAGAFGASAFCGSGAFGSAAKTGIMHISRRPATTAVADEKKCLWRNMQICFTVIVMLMTGFMPRKPRLVGGELHFIVSDFKLDTFL